MIVTEVEAPPATREPSVAGWGYRAHLDGLRAVAVYLVVAFHSGVDRLGGGFIGVDVFFVLSGYLVTQVLLRDLEGTGSIGFRRFYARRVRRLLPAAAVVLVTTTIVFRGVAQPPELPDAIDALRAASLYVANWHFIGQSSDYFAGDVSASPVMHFWSLSVEEQFYLLWPLILGGIVALARRTRDRSWRVVRAVVAAGMVLSVAGAIRLAGTQLSRAYYGTDTRAYQLLAGALLALSPGLIGALRASPAARRLLPAWAALALAGLAVLATSFVDVGAISRGVGATVLTVALITTLESADRGPVRWVLSLSPVVYLGRISYGIYLWHWLVVVIIARRFDLSPFPTAVITVVIASGLAALSFELLELPVREWRWLDQRRVRVVVAGLTSSALIAVVVAPQVLDRDAGAGDVVVAGGTSAREGTRVPADLDWEGAAADHEQLPSCTAAAPSGCTLVEGTGTHILLMGDSHAHMYLPALKLLAETRSLTLSVAVAPACPWQRGIIRRGRFRVGNTTQDLGPPCRVHHADWYDIVIPQLDPDVLVVANQPWDDPAGVREIEDEELGPVDAGTPEFLSVVRDRTREAVRAFRADGRTVVMLEPLPIAPDELDPLTCLSEATFLEQCRFVSNTEPTGVERVYRELAADSGEGVLDGDIDREVCPYLPICDPIVHGLIVRFDGQHLTRRFAATLDDALAATFDELRLLR